MKILRPNEHTAQINAIQILCVLTCDCGSGIPMLLSFQPKPQPDSVVCPGCGTTYFLAELHMDLHQGELKCAVAGKPGPLIAASHGLNGRLS